MHTPLHQSSFRIGPAKGASAVFVVNKIDKFSLSDDDSIRKALDNCKKHLQNRIGFQKVTLLPVCSRPALLLRLALSSLIPMSSSEILERYGVNYSKKDVFQKSTCSSYDQIELEQTLKTFSQYDIRYASALKFSSVMKKIFSELKGNFQENEKTRAKVLIANTFFTLHDLRYALFLSGIPMLEKHIENGLEKASK